MLLVSCAYVEDKKILRGQLGDDNCVMMVVTCISCLKLIRASVFEGVNNVLHSSQCPVSIYFHLVI